MTLDAFIKKVEILARLAGEGPNDINSLLALAREVEWWRVHACYRMCDDCDCQSCKIVRHTNATLGIEEGTAERRKEG